MLYNSPELLEPHIDFVCCQQRHHLNFNALTSKESSTVIQDGYMTSLEYKTFFKLCKNLPINGRQGLDQIHILEAEIVTVEEAKLQHFSQCHQA